MDNFTHSLTGWALGQAGLKKKTRKGLAALILAANMPDVDVFFAWVPWSPLATHRGVTHSLVGGVLLLPPVLAGLLWLLDRWQVRRGATFRSGLEMRFGWLVALCYLGALTHPLLDWQNSYAVQLLSPFSNLWFHNDSLFIIDVWLWTGLAFAIWLSRRREKRGAGRWRKPPILALTAMVAYIALNGTLTAYMKDRLQMREPYPQPDRIIATPAAILFWQREVLWREGGKITQAWFDPMRSMSTLQDIGKPVPTNMDDPLVRRALFARPDVEDFGNWSIATRATIERKPCRAIVRFNDARFAARAAPQFNREVALPLEGTGCPPSASD